MQVVINKKVSQKVSELAELFGQEREQAVKQALLSYLKSVLEQISLKKEMKAWQQVGLESWRKLEKSI